MSTKITIPIILLLLSCKTGPNYYVKITPSTINGRNKIISKEMKRMERKINKARKLKTKII